MPKKRAKAEDWTDPTGLLLLQSWAQQGLTQDQICENMERLRGVPISRRSLARWINKYPATIGAALNNGREMKQAEKFHRPIITFIDTPGAYPGKDAEERGQGEAIARNLMEMSGLTVPVLAIVTGEGSSGGALGLGVANHILMLENAVYSVLSPEGFASILWKDASRSGEACTMMKLTAQDLYADGIVEEVIPEPLGGAQRGRQLLFSRLDTAIAAHLAALCKMSGKALADQRYKKYRRIGEMRGA